MKIKKLALWESGGSLGRFGLLKFKSLTISFAAARIHRGASKALEAIHAERREMLLHFGAVEVDRRDEMGNPIKILIIEDAAQRAEFDKTWAKMMEEAIEFPGVSFKPSDLPVEFWGQDEQRDDAGKITKPAIQPMMDVQDIGALSEWLIVEEVAAEKAQAASGD